MRNVLALTSRRWTRSRVGRVRPLDGFGVTLGDAATRALVNISDGATAESLTPAPDSQQQSVPAGEPVYWPSGHGLIRARYVKIDVTDNDGTTPCIGEFRMFAPAPLNAIPDRGADLSSSRRRRPPELTSATAASPVHRFRSSIPTVSTTCG